jgi:hypothetical protein
VSVQPFISICHIVAPLKFALTLTLTSSAAEVR